MTLSREEIKAIAARSARDVMQRRNPETLSPKEQKLWEEGRELAKQIDNGVGYYGPWLPDGPDGELFGHLFQDDAVTKSSFPCKTLEDCKANLIKMREDWKAEPPVFTKQEKVNPCPNLQPMAEWIKGETPGTCRPCTLTPVVQWYWSELKERGFQEIADQLEAEVEVLEEDNVEQIMAVCKDLDKIKAAAPADLRKRLQEFDCSIQSFDPSEISTEPESADSKA